MRQLRILKKTSPSILLILWVFLVSVSYRSYKVSVGQFVERVIDQYIHDDVKYIGSDWVAPNDMWIPHLCPRYGRATKENLQGHRKIQTEAPSNDSIYFTQTSCRMTLKARESCAIESASKHHPDRPVLVLMTAPEINVEHPFMQTLLSLPKVKFGWLDLDDIFREQPLLSWHQRRTWLINQGRATTFVSDAIRTVLLERFGGTYLDLDALILRPLPNDTNWLARIDHNNLNLALASFVPQHPLLQVMTDALPQAFDPFKGESIGPKLVTRSLNKMCPDNITIPDSNDPDTIEYCSDITVYPSNVFYPLTYRIEDLRDMFLVGSGLGLKFFREHIGAYSLHLFNSFTNAGGTQLGRDSILEEVARRNCPKVYDVVIRQGFKL